MFGAILAIVIAVGLVYLKFKIRDDREQRNIQIAVERALEEERKKQQDKENCSK